MLARRLVTTSEALRGNRRGERFVTQSSVGERPRRAGQQWVRWERKNPKSSGVGEGLGCRGSGSWIRTNDLRVMSPTSCHCSIPRWDSFLAVALVPGRLPSEYRRCWGVSLPCSGWERV